LQQMNPKIQFDIYMSCSLQVTLIPPTARNHFLAVGFLWVTQYIVAIVVIEVWNLKM